MVVFFSAVTDGEPQREQLRWSTPDSSLENLKHRYYPTNDNSYS